MATWTQANGTYSYIEVTATESNVDNANNTSLVTVSVYEKSSTTAYNNYPGNRLLVKINNVLKADFNFAYDFRNGSRSKLLGTWSLPITHNADGTYNCPIYVFADMQNDPDATISQNLPLTAIPRATTPSAPKDIYMGSAVTINLPRAVSTFSHNVSYKFGNMTEYVEFATGVGASVTWTVPNLADKIPNREGDVLYLKADTYNNGVYMGSREYTGTILHVPNSYTPTAAVPTVAGVNTLFGTYVQGKSKVSASGTGSGIYGSSVVSSLITVKAGAETLGTGASPYTSPALIRSGTITVINTVTDSRGKTASTQTTIPVVSYTDPKVLEYKAYRSTATGVQSSSESYLHMIGKSSISPISNKNAKTTKIEFKRTIDTAWTVAATDTTNYNGVVDKIVAINTTDSYDIRLTIQDSYTTVTQLLKVGPAKIALSQARTNDGASLGLPYDYADTLGKALQVNGTAHFKDTATFDKPSVFKDTVTFERTIPQEAWQTPTFVNGWQDYGAPYSARYYKDTNGRVHLKGLVKGGAAGTVAFTLPVGYRPDNYLYLVVANGSGSSSFNRAYIAGTGEVTPAQATYTGWVSLDGISFNGV